MLRWKKKHVHAGRRNEKHARACKVNSPWYQKISVHMLPIKHYICISEQLHTSHQLKGLFQVQKESAKEKII